MPFALLPEPGRQAQQLAGEIPEQAAHQPGVHPGDGQVVSPEPEVGAAVLGIDDPGRHEAHRHPAPMETHHHLGVEIHPPAEAHLVKQGAARRQGVDPKAAHAVFDGEGEGLYPDPDMGDIAAIEAPLGHRVVIEGAARHQGRRVSRRLRQQARHVGQLVLAVRVYLHPMAEAARQCGPEPGHHGGPLAEVFGVAQQAEPIPMLLCQGVEGRRRDGLAAIVDQQAGQPQGFQPGQHPGQGGRMVVTGNEEAGIQGHSRTRPLLACSSPSR
ncbi:hypothetical protein D3C72_1043420 [compost metagenome]